MSRKAICGSTLTILVLATLVITTSYGDAPARHGHPRESLSIGDTAPDWGSLPATDGNRYSMADLDNQFLVVVFACHHCPTVVAYEDRIKQIQADYEDQDVRVVALNPNGIYPMSRMQERAEEKEYNFLYIMDESKESGHRFGARNTPHVFVLDEDRVVRYMGGIDNSPNEANAHQHHLRDALDALLEGQDPPVAETRALGCTVKYGCTEAYRARYL